MRRGLEGAAVAALLVVGAVPVAQWTASAATPNPACVTWTDPADDATTAQVPAALGVVFGDKNLDIVSTTLTTTADSLSAVVKVQALNGTPSDAGDQLTVDFTAAGKALQLYTVRAGTPASGNHVGIYNGSYADGKATATYDVKASTVTLTAKLSDLSEAAGTSMKGAKATGLEVTTGDDFLNEGGFGYDSSTTDQAVSLGTACGGSGKPGPTPGATPTPKPTTGGSTGGPQASADPTKDFPKAGCTTLPDAKGDSSFSAVSGAPGAPNDPDTDITGLTLRTTTTDLVAYIGVDKLAAGPSTTDGHRFTLDFTFNGHVFAAAASSSTRGSSAIRDVAANSGAVGHVTQLSVDAPPLTGVNTSSPSDRGFRTSGLKATFDLANSRVVLVLPLADIEKYAGAKLAGKLTAVDAKSAVDTNTVSTQADSTNPGNATTGEATWTVNDNACFPVAKKK